MKRAAVALFVLLTACAKKPTSWDKTEVMIPMRDGIKLQHAGLTRRKMRPASCLCSSSDLLMAGPMVDRSAPLRLATNNG